jgi:hypothetical protein
MIQNLGHHLIILLALGLYSIRLTGYSFLTAPEPVLIFEAMKPFCTTLLLISAMTFIKDVSPMSTAATMEGVFGWVLSLYHFNYPNCERQRVVWIMLSVHRCSPDNLYMAPVTY